MKRTNNHIVLSGVILITVCCHLLSLKNHLVADSWVFLIPHSFSETFGYFFKSIIPSEWHALWLRPVPMFFFWFDNIIWPETEWGPHLTNIFFHACNVWLIWLLIHFIYSQSISPKSKSSCQLAAFTACLFYGLHPLNVGAVGWVAARFDVMSVTFGLTGMLLWLKWDAGSGFKNTLNLFISLFLFMCAILSKEQGIVFLMVCVVLSFARIFSGVKIWEKYLVNIVIISIFTAIYVGYRLIIFKGMGGYLESKQALSVIPPLSYFTAIFFPYQNILPIWTFSIPFWITCILITTLAIFMWFVHEKNDAHVSWIYFVGAITLFVAGIATTAPHAGMRFNEILGHMESRFALIAITGFSLLLGLVVMSLVRSILTRRIMLIVMLIWGITAAWRTTVQIQAWKFSGLIANHIISTTLSEAPDPPENSRIAFFEIPRDTDQNAYIFGIGLKEAILRNYPGRTDITIIPRAKGSDLKQLKPDRDYVFGFNKAKYKLERLNPRFKEGINLFEESKQ